jgi:hypothetical protein
MTGWKVPRAAARLLTLALVLASGISLAEDSSDAALPEGLLEFLADWEDERGEWQDPLEYLDPQWETLDERVGQSDE